MWKVLIVSGSRESAGKIAAELENFKNEGVDVSTAESGDDARRLAAEFCFDLALINAPLLDELGSALAKTLAAGSATQVILLVRAAIAGEVGQDAEEYGVFTVPKPFSREQLWSALKFASAARNRMKRLEVENTRLLGKLEDIKLIDRAKCILIEHLAMTEQQAHKHIEKEAMDRRVSRREIANNILRTYEK
ncbi:MAG: ANTAR domain-containing protein [Clostridiales bacterium]|jgi:response regulator NasT|nr:ANTAR domain-containing protein [Clostridiales bacterium]